MPRIVVPTNIIGTANNDTVKGEETTTNLAIGIQVLNQGIINTGAGADRIVGIGKLTSFDLDPSDEVDGISNDGTIQSGDGNDEISGTASTLPSAGGTIAGIKSRGIISTGAGADRITGTATSINGLSNSIGIKLTNGSSIDTGSNDDFISGNAKATGNSAGMGIFLQQATINAGTGNDKIIGTATGTGANGIFNVAALLYGINNESSSQINGGNGNDLIKGIGIGTDIRKVSGIENSSVIDCGDGNDTLTGIGISTQSGNLSFPEPSNGIGINNSFGGNIYGGQGNDRILGYGTQVGIQGAGDGLIDGGSGDDFFKARIITGLDAQGNPIESSNQGGAINGATIQGGLGCDVFDVGYGNARLDGGAGYDTLKLVGTADKYNIQGSQDNLTITRDGYTLLALNIEQIVFGA
jgi:hypothetical protein